MPLNQNRDCARARPMTVQGFLFTAAALPSVLRRHSMNREKRKIYFCYFIAVAMIFAVSAWPRQSVADSQATGPAVPRRPLVLVIKAVNLSDDVLLSRDIDVSESDLFHIDGLSAASRWLTAGTTGKIEKENIPVVVWFKRSTGGSETAVTEISAILKIDDSAKAFRYPDLGLILFLSIGRNAQGSGPPVQTADLNSAQFYALYSAMIALNTNDHRLFLECFPAEAGSKTADISRPEFEKMRKAWKAAYPRLHPDDCRVRWTRLDEAAIDYAVVLKTGPAVNFPLFKSGILVKPKGYDWKIKKGGVR